MSLVVMGALFPLLLFSQKPNYTFRSINQPDGLINNTVQTIFEDSFGFIWLGTHHGLQRYDGKSYKNFEHSSNDTAGLSQNYINALCEDKNSNIWIATSYGLNTYEREKNRVFKYKWENIEVRKNGEPFIYDIIKDDDNEDILWIVAANIGLIKLNIQNDSATIFASQTYNDYHFRWILPYPGKKNKLLLGGSSLFSFDKNTGQFDELLVLAQNARLPNNLINDAAIDPSDKGIIWLATGDFWGRGTLGGLIKFDLRDNKSILISPETRNGDLHERHLLCLHFSDNDHLWIGSRYSGALLYIKNEDRFYNYEYNKFDEGSLSTDNSVRSILIDRSGTIWFGTWGDGISTLSPTAQKFSRHQHIPQEKSGLTDNFINTFAEDKTGNIWIGTKSGGLIKFNPGQYTFKNYFQEFASSDNNNIEINYLFYDSHENLWIGTHDDALYRYTPSSGAKVHYQEGPTEYDVSQKRISTINELKPGEILISTYGGGLNIYNYATDKFLHYTHDPQDSTSIPDNQIWLPFLGNDGRYYFSGNSTAGLIQFDPETEIFREIFPRRVLTTFMMPCVTPEGRIFVNEVAEGLSEIEIKDTISVKTVLDINGNSIKNVESILADDQNRLWLGTGNGLIEYDLVTKNVHRYDVSDGLLGHEFNRLAAFQSSSGEFYFGGKNGFNVFHPNTIELSNYYSPIVFTGLKLFQEDVEIGEESPLKENILLLDKLELDYDQNNFSLSFAALDFSNPQKILYKYILENHDKEWIFAGQNNFAGYTNMDPGNYTLKVLATNSDGIWHHEAKSLRIIINPPWWQTKWAYGFYVLLFIASIFGFDRYMRKRLVSKERERNRAFKLEQARKIEKAYNELKSTQAQLIHSEKMASLGELTAGIAHEIQNPLNFVNNFSEVNSDLIKELKEELEKGDLKEVSAIAADIAQNESKITHHGKRADSIVKGMLQHSRSNNGKKTLIDLNVLAEEYLRLSYHGLRAKDKSFNADFKTELDASLPKINVVPQDIGRVLLNLINNAFYAVSAKASAKVDKEFKPTVVVSTKKTDNKVEIRVKDNGDGISGDVKDKIFQPFFTTKPTGIGTGLGLSLSYDIITKGHGGELKVVSKEAKGNLPEEQAGTTFIIYLPLI